MKKLINGSVLISSVLFIACLVLLWLYIAVLPVWLTDPYTYRAYNNAKHLADELNQTLSIYSKNYGMATNFSDFTRIETGADKLSSDSYSFEHLIKKGVKVGSVDKDTLRFNNLEIDGDMLEVDWVCQNVTAIFTLKENSVFAHVRAIFNMGEIIEEDINPDPSFLFQ